jgi:hypothetical protein
MQIQLEHLSYSSIKTFYDCPYSFYKYYVLKERPETEKKAYLLGKAFHLGLEKMVLNEPVEEAVIELLEEGKPKIPDLDLEKFDKEVKQLFDNFYAFREDFEAGKIFKPLELPDLETGEILPVVEQRIKAEPTFKEGLLPMVGVIDAVDDDYTPIDYKYVTSYSTDASKYFVQAWFYKNLIEYQYNKTPEMAKFIEVKKAKNRDKSPQWRVIEIYFDPKYEGNDNYVNTEKLNQWYEGTCYNILNTQVFMPNPFGFFDNDEFKNYMNG